MSNVKKLATKKVARSHHVLHAYSSIKISSLVAVKHFLKQKTNVGVYWEYFPTGTVQVSHFFEANFSKIWENLFDSRTKVTLVTFLDTHYAKTALRRLFASWVSIGNRTRIKGSTSLCVNRYTIDTILNTKTETSLFVFVC